MIEESMCCNRPPTEYKTGDKVLLRLKSRKGRIAPKRRHILNGRVVARNLKTSIYKVSFMNPTSNKRVQKWISVEDITSVSSQEEKAKRKEQVQKKKKRLHRKKFRIVLTRKDRLEFFRESTSIVLEPRRMAIVSSCFFLRRIGIERSSETLRKEIGRYLREHPNDLEGFPLELFAGQGWAEYLAEMNKDGTYGHFAEGQGEHYVCLEVEVNAAENCSNDRQEKQEVLNEDENETEKAEEKNGKGENKRNGGGNRENERVKEGIYENPNDNGHQQRRSKETCSFDHLPNEIIAMIFETAI